MQAKRAITTNAVERAAIEKQIDAKKEDLKSTKVVNHLNPKTNAPFQKSWWFWTVIGLAIILIAVAVALYFRQKS